MSVRQHEGGMTGYEDDVPIYNPRFLAFATHYGFRPVACRVRRPQTKGKVERPFFLVETSLFCGRSFDSLDRLNETAAWWLAHLADVRELRGFGQTPAERHRDELPRLIPLPACRYEIAPVVFARSARGDDQLRPERLLGAVAVYRTRAAGAGQRAGR